MEVLVYNIEQPGCSYYYSPLTVYNLRAVNHAYKYGVGDRKVEYKEHMHTHVYQMDNYPGRNYLVLKVLVKKMTPQKYYLGRVPR
jgi:hypothetical protein